MILEILKVYILLGQASTITFHHILQRHGKFNNDVTMDLMKRIVNHTGNKCPVVADTTTLSSENMIDKDEYDKINNDISHYDNLFQPGKFGASPELDVSLSQIRIV